MTTQMGDEERRAFLSAGSRTGILSTVRKDGRPHAAPVWFVLDGDDILFNTGADTLKGRTLRRAGYAVLTVDDPNPPFAYVSVGGPARICEDVEEMLPWSIALGRRYMGDDAAEQFGRRNAVPGELLVRIVPDSIVAFSGIAD
jgi:PPOX class probable F420-dependent enzyme